MRIYGLHSGRNKPAYYLARSYMWASRDTKRRTADKSQKPDNSLTGNETTIRVASDFSKYNKENSELELACMEWINNNNVTNPALIYGVLITIIGIFVLIFSIPVGATIFIIGLILCGYGSIDTSIKKKAQEESKPVIEYQIDGESIVDELLKQGITSSKLMTYNAFTANAKAKVNSGATNIYDLKDITFSTSGIPFLKVNVTVYSFRSLLWELYLLPDMCIFKEGNSIHTIALSDLRVDFSEFVIRMPDTKPFDCDVIDNTWLYVNKNGSPDRRYSNNKQVPICRLGEISLKSTSGLNIRILSSKYDVSKKKYQKISKLLL